MSITNTPPFPALERSWNNTLILIGELSQPRPDLLSASVCEGSGLVVNIPNLAQPGYTWIQRILPGGAQLRMVDMHGQEIHR